MFTRGIINNVTTQNVVNRYRETKKFFFFNTKQESILLLFSKTLSFTLRFKKTKLPLHFL